MKGFIGYAAGRMAGRKGDLSFLMWLLIGIAVLLAIIVVIIGLKNKSLGIIDIIRGGA